MADDYVELAVHGVPVAEVERRASNHDVRACSTRSAASAGRVAVPGRPPAETEPWAPTSSGGSSGCSCCCSSISFITFVIFYILPSADPALLRAGRGAERRARRLDPRPARPQRAVVRAVLDVHEGRRLPLRLRLQLLQPGLGQGPDLRPPAGDDLARPRRDGHLAARRHPDRDHLRGQARHAGSTRRRWASRSSRSRRRSTGSASSRSTSSPSDLGVFPIFKGSGTYPLDCNVLQCPDQVVPSLILPWIVLAASFAAIYARFLRGNLIEVLGEDYIRTARAKGLRRAARDPAPRRALAPITPLVTILGLDLGILLGGAILTETVFNIPGIGRLVLRRDPEERPADGPGHRALRRVLHHLPEPHRRHRLRVPRPAGAVQLMAAPRGPRPHRLVRDRGRPRPGRRRRLLHGRARPGARHRRRVRLGQERLVADGDGPDPLRRQRASSAARCCSRAATC